MTTWRELIAEEMDRSGDPGPVEWCSATDEEMSRDFDNRMGQGLPFTAWTRHRVYFPVTYDWSQWVGSVPRHPCDEATEPQGG